MATKRKKTLVVSGVSKEQYNSALGEYATADAKKQSMIAKMDEEMTKIREKYADPLQDLDKVIEEKFELVKVYCTENKEELFTKKRSAETAHGTVGFRTGTPKLKTKKGFTWMSVLELLKTKKLKQYIRVKEEVDKDLFLVNRKDNKVIQLMPEVGVEVVQEETFFIELKKEEAEAV